MAQYFLGVDVGGTKCHALIADQEGNARGFAESGPGNHEVVGYNGLKAALKEITTSALRGAGIKINQVVGAGFGVAGYDWPSEREPTFEAISTLGLECPFEAVNDTIVGLLAGTTKGWGVAVVGGTGCNCWGWNQERKIGHVSGCGGLFGEHGGGGDIVHRAIQSVAYEWSGRGPATKLTTAFLERTGARDLDDLLEGLILDRYHLNSYVAPTVFQIANEGDPVAQDVLRWAGYELGMLGVTVINQLNIKDLEFEVVMVGSLYRGSPILVDTMRATIHEVAPKAVLVPLSAPPVVGGVLLGMEKAGLTAQHFRERLVETTREYMEIYTSWV